EAGKGGDSAAHLPPAGERGGRPANLCPGARRRGGAGHPPAAAGAGRPLPPPVGRPVRPGTRWRGGNSMKRSGFAVMARLIGLVGPLTGYMLLAIFLGLAGHLCAAFLTVLGGYAALEVLGFGSLPLGALFAG